MENRFFLIQIGLLNWIFVYSAQTVWTWLPVAPIWWLRYILIRRHFLFIYITYTFTDFEYSNNDSCSHFITFLYFFICKFHNFSNFNTRTFTQLPKKDYIVQLKNQYVVIYSISSKYRLPLRGELLFHMQNCLWFLEMLNRTVSYNITLFEIPIGNKLKW